MDANDKMVFAIFRVDFFKAYPFLEGREIRSRGEVYSDSSLERPGMKTYRFPVEIAGNKYDVTCEQMYGASDLRFTGFRIYDDHMVLVDEERLKEEVGLDDEEKYSLLRIYIDICKECPELKGRIDIHSVNTIFNVACKKTEAWATIRADHPVQFYQTAENTFDVTICCTPYQNDEGMIRYKNFIFRSRETDGIISYPNLLAKIGIKPENEMIIEQDKRLSKASDKARKLFRETEYKFDVIADNEKPKDEVDTSEPSSLWALASKVAADDAAHLPGKFNGLMVCEECSEAVKAFTKYYRGKGDEDDIRDELIDILVATTVGLTQLVDDPEDIRRRMGYKLERQLLRNKYDQKR